MSNGDDPFALDYLTGEPGEANKNILAPPLQPIYQPRPQFTGVDGSLPLPTYQPQPLYNQNYYEEPFYPQEDYYEEKAPTLYVESKRPFPVLAVVIGIFVVLFIIGIILIIFVKNKKKTLKNEGKAIKAIKSDKSDKDDSKSEKDDKIKSGKESKSTKKPKTGKPGKGTKTSPKIQPPSKSGKIPVDVK